MIKKRDFPSFGALTCQFDLEKLYRAYKLMESNSASEPLRRTIEAREDIARYFPFADGGYQYVPVTAPPATENLDQVASEFSSYSTLKKARVLLKDTGAFSVFDERAYTEFFPEVPAELRQELEKLQGRLARARFVNLKTGKKILPHVDHPLHISVRIHIPIITNDRVVFSVQRNKKWESFHLPANGQAYFVNTAFPHQVENLGNEDRIHLVLNLKTFEDIQHLSLKEVS